MDACMRPFARRARSPTCRQQTSELIRQEMRLAKAELSDNLADAGRHAAMIGAAIAFGLAAVITVAAAIALLFVELGVVPWLAAGDHGGADGLRRVCARAVGHFGAAQEIDRPRRNDPFPQGDDPVAQEPFDPLTPARRGQLDQGQTHTESIKREIEQTRVVMSETIGEIQDRLRPDHLLQQAKDGVREAATGKVKKHHAFGKRNEPSVAAERRVTVGNHLAWYAKEHPIRMAITAGVITWWMMRGRSTAPAAVVRRGRHVVGLRRVQPIEPTLRDRVGDTRRRARRSASTRDGAPGGWRLRRDARATPSANTRPSRARRRRIRASTRRRRVASRRVAAPPARDHDARSVGPRQSAGGRRHCGRGRRGDRPGDAAAPTSRIARWAGPAIRRWRRRGTSPPT